MFTEHRSMVWWQQKRKTYARAARIAYATKDYKTATICQIWARYAHRNIVALM